MLQAEIDGTFWAGASAAMLREDAREYKWLEASRAERLEELGHNGAGVLWQGEILLVGLGLVAVDQKTHQLIFLVCFKHDVRHSCRGTGHTDLEEI